MADAISEIVTRLLSCGIGKAIKSDDSTMRCSQAKKLISLFLNSELAETQRQKVDEHLSHCRACQKLASEYLVLSRLSHSLSPPEPEGFYDHFFAEVMARTTPSAGNRKSAIKHFAFPALRPRFAFAGIGILLAAVTIGILFMKEPPRITLEEYLLQRNFTTLARAIADDRQRSALVKDSVSVELLIESLKALDRMNAGYGQVSQYLAPVMAMLRQELSKRQVESAQDPPRHAGPKVLRAGMFAGGIDFKRTIRALRMIDRPGFKITLIDLAKYWPDAHRQAHL